ncbi:uncharacterized protein DUF4397 [Melghirimyces profundicolus]|uniref:Uncharacterized protein DUF4397 n=1 Tax=Melghirimyces profundicolus TaxID=1242148 RepID=A0A2T6C930_9BACL|nr:DUF4397 domain-containing protein [Melghirimyces profundicolus]PTX64801.1 uncharacterized protein DUF4397 [Melghirimyces profundicolus]
MVVRSEFKRALEKAHMYGLLAEYYKFRDPDLYMYYYQKHYKYTKKVAALARGADTRMTGEGRNESVPVSRRELEEGDRRQDPARIRVLHASPDAPAVDVVINGRTLAPNLSFGQVSPTLALPAGSYRVDLFRAGRRGTPLYSEGITLQPGRTYTVAAVNPLDNLDLQVIESEPEVREGMSKFRLIHLSPDAPPVDLATREGDVLLFNLRYRDESEYYVSPPATQDLELRAAGSERVLVEIPNVRLEPNRAYSIYVLGRERRAPRLRAVVLQD